MKPLVAFLCISAGLVVTACVAAMGSGRAEPGQDAWKFADPPNVGVYTTALVIKDGEPVMYVAHDANGGAWQFHAGPKKGSGALSEVMVVSLRSMIERDPSLIELADLPLGWTAERTSPKGRWTRSGSEMIMHLGPPR